MTEIIGVRFKSGGKQYYFDPNGQAEPQTKYFGNVVPASAGEVENG